MTERVPRPLVALMAVSLILGLGWAALTPAFQAPDEQSHFAYTQYLAETGGLPGDLAKPIYSSEHIQGSVALNADQVPGQPMVKPEWSDVIRDAWAVPPAQGRRTDDGGGANTAAAYPPASYLWQSGAYHALGGDDVFERIFAARLASAVWLPITVLATWLLAGEVFGRRRLLQTCAAAVPALLPMMAFVSGSVSPEGMLYALWALALWLGVRVLRRGLTPATGAALGAVVALGCLTKATSYALLPAFLLAVAVGLVRYRGSARGRGLSLAAAAAPVVAILGGWFLVARAAQRPAAAQLTSAAPPADADWLGFVTYLWQFYLPDLPGQAAFPFLPTGYPAFQVWIKQGWAAFGWLEVRFPVGVYQVLAILTVAVLAGGAVALWRARRRVDLAVLAFLGLAAASQLGGLHWTDYNFQLAGNPFMQGRYVFPILPLAALALAGVISVLSPPGRRRAAGVAVGALFAFHLAAVGLTLDRFYA